MKKLISVLLLTVSLFATAQNPFNYGKSKKLYFLSRSEIKKRGMDYIYTTSFPAKKEDVPEEAYVTIIDFSQPNQYRNGWYPYTGTAKKRLLLKQLLDSSDFMNGTFYEFDEKGKITTSGMEGRGALCQQEYTSQDSFTIVDVFCKFGKSTTNSRIYYHNNGLPSYSVCCQTDFFEPEADSTDDTTAVPVYADTTWYFYDRQWKITAIKTKEGLNKIFSLANRHPEGDYTCFVGRQRFELFIDKSIGYRPRIILLEIYRNAVLVFKYDDKVKKYYEAGEISLE